VGAARGARLGLARAWLAGMVLAVVTFVWAALLGEGDVVGFRRLRGQRRGAGRRPGLPGALLAGVMQRAGHGGQLEGGYFGWWNFATKLNLALAAGVALPLLQLLGYTPGAARRRGAAGADRRLLPAALPAEAAGRRAAVAGGWIEGNPDE
jgi:GPH family glycoside/pentoside/hexuronide:cation symporter